MPIQVISRSLFDQLHPARLTSAGWIQDEVEWFAERSRSLIGYIARNVQSSDWLCVIEGRDERGQFYEIESRDGLGTQEDARAVLEKRMNELMATGLKVFPRLSGVLPSR
jgi:hypothetical protein